MKITLPMQNGITAHALARMCRGVLQNEKNRAIIKTQRERDNPQE